jgi:hypothetical protein
VKRAARTPATAKSSSSTRKPPVTKARPAAARARKPAATAARPAGTKPATTTAAVARKPAPRADFGAPIDGFFARQPPPLRAILEQLRSLVEAAAPDAVAALKWGMPVYTIDGTILCALGGHKSHVNLILSGPPDAFADPDRRLTGEARTGRHLKLTAADAIPRQVVRAWLATAAKLARGK